MVEKQEKKDIEFISSKEERAELKKFSFKQWMSGSVLAKSSFRAQLPFVIYMAFLGFELTRDLNILQRDLDELRAESINTAPGLMFFCRQSQVQKRINETGLGLREAVAPPVKIKRYE